MGKTFEISFNLFFKRIHLKSLCSVSSEPRVSGDLRGFYVKFKIYKGEKEKICT